MIPSEDLARSGHRSRWTAAAERGKTGWATRPRSAAHFPFRHSTRLGRYHLRIPYETRVLADQGFAIIRAYGLVSVAQRVEAIGQLLANSAFRRGMPILVDTRGVAEPPPSEDAERIAAFHSRTLLGHPVAYLANPGVQYAASRQVSVVYERAGIPIEVFTEEPEAVAWLTASRAT